MDFSTHIKSVPNAREQLIGKIAEITRSSRSSVYRWISGECRPAPIKQKIIADYLGISIEELFPAES